MHISSSAKQVRYSSVAKQFSPLSSVRGLPSDSTFGGQAHALVFLFCLFSWQYVWSGGDPDHHYWFHSLPCMPEVPRAERRGGADMPKRECDVLMFPIGFDCLPESKTITRFATGQTEQVYFLSIYVVKNCYQWLF